MNEFADVLADDAGLVRAMIVFLSALFFPLLSDCPSYLFLSPLLSFFSHLFSPLSLL
jgi:hypothetical protein